MTLMLAAVKDAKGQKVSPAWQRPEVAACRLWERDCRLVSLSEIMEHFYPTFFLALAQLWGTQAMVWDRDDADPVSESMQTGLREVHTLLKSVCSDMGLRTSVVTIDKILDHLTDQNPASGKLSILLDELHGRLSDEMKGTVFLSLSLKESEEYDHPRKGWEEVIDRFPSVIRDVEEASKCLAFSRNTACVFHLMRVMESGLVVLGRKVGVTKKSPTWDAILGAVDRKLNPKPGVKKTGRWRRDEPWFAEANSMLRAVKIAWRNPTMHVTRAYDEEEAREVYAAVKSFMSHLASKLKE